MVRNGHQSFDKSRLNCRFSKCGTRVLRKDKERHEEVLCQHRTVLCEKDCELEIAVKDLDAHDCMRALKTKVAGRV